MISSLNTWITRLPRAALLVVVVVLVIGIAAADYLTGPQLSFSIFYLIPVVVAAWHGHPGSVVFTCLLSAAVWFMVDFASMNYSNWPIPVWNGGVRLGFFVITAALLFQLKDILVRQTELADMDDLSGLLNRRAFERRASFVFQLADRHRRNLALGYIDVDDFKKINDTFGHHVGDEVLRCIGRVLRERLRETDVLGRVGGDEFAVLLPETDRAGTVHLIDDLQKHLRQLASDRQWAIGFSIGVVLCAPPLPGLEIAIRHADRLMYRSKRQRSGLPMIEYYSDPGTAREN